MSERKKDLLQNLNKKKNKMNYMLKKARIVHEKSFKKIIL